MFVYSKQFLKKTFWISLLLEQTAAHEKACKVHFCPDNCQVRAPRLFEKCWQIYILFSISLPQRVSWLKYAGDSHSSCHVRWKSLSYKHCRKQNILQPSLASVLEINLYNLRWLSTSLFALEAILTCMTFTVLKLATICQLQLRFFNKQQSNQSGF